MTGEGGSGVLGGKRRERLGRERAWAPSVCVSCSRLILQLIKPNIPDGVSVGLLGAGPLPHNAATASQEGQVDGG